MHCLSRFQRWMLQRILIRLICDHQLPWLFSEIRRLSSEVWTEDNDPTVEDLVIESFLSEQANYFKFTKAFQRKLLDSQR